MKKCKTHFTKNYFYIHITYLFINYIAKAKHHPTM